MPPVRSSPIITGTDGALTVVLDGPQATEALAADIAGALGRGDVVALFGDLGSGKTVFARALIRALGAAFGREIGEVPSPTYTLVQPYELPNLAVHHYDLYRLSSAGEAIELAIEDAFVEGICVVEWAERIEGLLPAACLRVRLEFGASENERVARIAGLRHG